MGAGIHGGFGMGTKGAQDSQTDSLIKELEKSGAKFTEKDILFVTKDATGQLVWLEKGNKSAGLEHIINGDGKSSGHAADFEKAFGISKDQVACYLNKVISYGKIISNKLVKRGSCEGFERVYYYLGKYYVITGIGTNGFIISAYPKKIKGEE